MYCLNNIKINNFRCYLNKEYSFTPTINVFVGDNAVGKTSAVEAISYLILGKSFKNVKDSETIKENEKYFSLVGEFQGNDKIDRIVVYLDEKGKRISKNTNQFSKISDFIGEKGLVSFSPDDLKLVKGSPQERRKYLDLCICQIDAEYLNSLTIYNKVLKQRNEYLKTLSNCQIDNLFLDVLNEKIISLGKIIVEKRFWFIEQIKSKAMEINNNLSNNKDLLEIQYQPKIDLKNYDRDFLNRFNHDVFNQTTTGGPHRDDIIIGINNKSASCSSQGQARCATLSLKLAFYDVLKQNKKPIIVIMDDVLSELDEERQNNLFKLLDENCQIFITCTNIKLLTNEIVNKSNVIHIGKE